MRTASEVHDWVKQYNWDDGFLEIWPLVEDSETEFATALLIYWRLEGPWLMETGTEAARLHNTVAERLLNGFYANRNLVYHPVEEYDLSKTQVYKLRKAGVPQELIEPEYVT